MQVQFVKKTGVLWEKLTNPSSMQGQGTAGHLSHNQKDRGHLLGFSHWVQAVVPRYTSLVESTNCAQITYFSQRLEIVGVLLDSK